MDKETAPLNRKPELRGIIADLAICIAKSQRITTWATMFLSEDHKEIQSTLREILAELLRIRERVTALHDYDYSELVAQLRESRNTLRTIGVYNSELDTLTQAIEALE